MKNLRKYGVPTLLVFIGILTAFWYFNEISVEAKSTNGESNAIMFDFGQPSDAKAEPLKKQEINSDLMLFYGQLEAQLKSEAVSLDGDIAITYLDLKTGQKVSINGSQVFHGASTTKVPLVMLISDKVRAGELSWNQQVKYDKKFFESGTGKIQEDIKSSYSLADLAQQSITTSDNIAKNMLYSLLGGNEAGMKQIYSTYLHAESTKGENEITSEKMALILEFLYDQREVKPEYQQLLNNMKNTVFHDRLETAATAGKVAHKIGTYEEEVDDVGVFFHEHPYVLTIYTSKLDDAEKVISKFSDKVWNIQTSDYPAS